MDIGHGERFAEERSHLFVTEAGNAATDTGDEEDKFRMLLGICDKLIDVRFDRLQSTLHRRDGIALPAYWAMTVPNATPSIFMPNP